MLLTWNRISQGELAFGVNRFCIYTGIIGSVIIFMQFVITNVNFSVKVHSQAFVTNASLVTKFVQFYQELLMTQCFLYTVLLVVCYLFYASTAVH